MAFVSELLTTLLIAIILATVAFAGVLSGKYLRMKKVARSAVKEDTLQ